MAGLGYNVPIIPSCERDLVVPMTRQAEWTEKQGLMKYNIVH